MSTAVTKDLVRRVLEEYWVNGNEAVLNECFAPDIVNHDLSLPEVRGVDEFKQWARGLRAAYAVGLPDWRVTIEDLIGEGDRAVVKRYVTKGTHTGEFLGFAPTGKKISIRGVSIYCFRDGKVSDIWWMYDVAGLIAQLQPAPAPAELLATPLT